ncbi:MAG: cytochrome C oxidase subunit IV family protein [Proteobacteria bacterium]|nr:cytochrome C oxidase subunit IV family protein [Pseudomonadota bacterium]
MSEQVVLDGGAAPGAHPITPVRVYLGIYAALIALTGVTVGISYADLGSGALYLALFVALIKAGLVVGYFMHLKYDPRLHQLVFFASGVFLIFMFGFTFIDLISRPAILAEQGSLVLAQERQNAEEEAELRRRLAAAQAAASPAPSAAPSLAPEAATASADATPGDAAEARPVAGAKALGARSTGSARADAGVSPQ